TSGVLQASSTDRKKNRRCSAPTSHSGSAWPLGWLPISCLEGRGRGMGQETGSGCKLCPRHWAPYRDKCYWFSEENEYWSRGRDDCSWRGSHLLVIQDQEELNLTGNQNPVWIGLNITSQRKNWTWVDGSPLNQTLFTVSGPAEENSCAAVKKNQIKSEICNTHYKWICQKEAVLI
uniref:C-type lectin domain-containing protein n=1 Tax=Terrapene triunguis TaxID=2587831 RepID=A0A674IMC7_9SAUR